MPHFGLMDENALGPVEGNLMRSRLHIRCGLRRMREGKISLGILTLYDALICAMQWYTMSEKYRNTYKFEDDENINDDKTVYNVLVRSGVLDGKFDYSKFNSLVERALKKDLISYNYEHLLNDLESVMTRLGVMPFDENELPPEDPEKIRNEKL